MEKMFLEFQSKYNVEETADKLSGIILANEWKVSHVHDLQQTLQKNGFDVLPVRVIELCNPKHSSKLLTQDNERIYSALMPCRISIYDKTDGKTYISVMNSGAMAQQIGGLVLDVMNEAFLDSMKFIKEVSVDM